MDQEFVENGLTDARIDLEVVMDPSVFKIGGCNNITAQQAKNKWKNYWKCYWCQKSLLSMKKS